MRIAMQIGDRAFLISGNAVILKVMNRAIVTYGT
jgi:hypothetical protein